MESKRTRWLVIAYLLVQSMVGASWWIVMLANPPWRVWFFSLDSAGTLHWAILIADMPLFVGGSLVAAIVVAKRWSSAPLVLAFVAGAVWYAGLFAVGQAVTTPHTWPGAAMMLPCMIATVWALLAICKRPTGVP